MIHRIRCTNRMPALFNCNNNEQLSLEWDWHRPSYFCYFCYWWCTVQLTAYNKGKSVRVERNSYHWIKGPRRKEKKQELVESKRKWTIKIIKLMPPEEKEPGVATSLPLRGEHLLLMSLTLLFFLLYQLFIGFFKPVKQ